MAENYGLITCNLCGREYKRYVAKESSQVYGVSPQRNKSWSLVLKFVDNDKSEVNKHICTYCIADIVNKFGI